MPTDVQLLNDLFPTANTSQRATNNATELGSEDFLRLLVTQLQNQTPTEPTDNTEFIAQLAQFGTVSGVQDLNDSFSSFSSVLFGNQGLQAAGLVGSEVLTATSVGFLGVEQSVSGTIAVPEAANNVNVQVRDPSGALVRTLALGPSAQGVFEFEWDGTDGSGELVPPGNYSFSAEAVIGAQPRAVDLNVRSQVDSVTVDRNGADVLLNLDNGQQINIAQVLGFR